MAPRSRRTLLGRTPSPARRTSSPARASVGVEAPPTEDDEILAAEEADDEILAALDAELDATLDREPEAHLTLGAAAARGRAAPHRAPSREDPSKADDFEDALHVEEVFSARHWENDDRADSGVMDEVSESGWRGRSAFPNPERFDDPTVKVRGAPASALSELAFVDAGDEREPTIGRHLVRVSDDDLLEKTERLPQRRAARADQANHPDREDAPRGPSPAAASTGDATPRPAEDRAWVLWLVGSGSAVALGLTVAAALVGAGVASLIWPVERAAAPADEVVAPATPAPAPQPVAAEPAEPAEPPVPAEPTEPPEAAAPAAPAPPRPRKPAPAPVAAPEPPPPPPVEVAPEPTPPAPVVVEEEEEEGKKKRKKKDR